MKTTAGIIVAEGEKNRPLLIGNSTGRNGGSFMAASNKGKILKRYAGKFTTETTECRENNEDLRKTLLNRTKCRNSGRF